MPVACRLRRVAGVLCAAIGVVAISTAPARAGPPRVRKALRPPPLAPAYRLGSAARPFGWSTAIGDLNADGRPDYAIADRLFHRPSGFAYSLELVIAGVGSRSVTFDAPNDALTVSLRDVDHDRDLDVVVTAVLSRAVVAVWLNDGAGRFHRAPAQALPDASASDAAALTSAHRSDLVAAESVSSRIAHALIAVGRVFGTHHPPSAIARITPFQIAGVRIARLRPRAPPRSYRSAPVSVSQST